MKCASTARLWHAEVSWPRSACLTPVSATGLIPLGRRARSSSSSAGQPGHRAKQVLIRGVGVDRRRQDRLVAGEALGEADVLGLAVDGRAGRVTQDVEAHVAVEA